MVLFWSFSGRNRRIRENTFTIVYICSFQNMTDFAKKLKAIRVHKKMSAKDVYTAADLFPSYYYRLEKGEVKDPAYSTITLLSRVLGVREEYFLYDLTPHEMELYEKARPMMERLAQLNDEVLITKLEEMIDSVYMTRNIEAIRKDRSLPKPRKATA